MTAISEALSDEKLSEMLAGLEGVTPGPWQIGRLGTEDMPHVVDFGPPPKSPYMIVRPGSPAKGGYIGHSAGGVAHADDDSSPANAAHIARCDPDTIRALILELQSLRSGNGGEVRGEAQAIVVAIDELRREEGSTVEILCDNPDFNGQPNNAVIVNADWTRYEDHRVSGHTLRGALENAVAIKKMAIEAGISALSTPPVGAETGEPVAYVERSRLEALARGKTTERGFDVPAITAMLAHPAMGQGYLTDGVPLFAAPPCSDKANVDWVMVPREPTREMWAAMGNVLVGYKNRHHDKVAADLYAAILSASLVSQGAGE